MVAGRLRGPGRDVFFLQRGWREFGGEGLQRGTSGVEPEDVTKVTTLKKEGLGRRKNVNLGKI